MMHSLTRSAVLRLLLFPLLFLLAQPSHSQQISPADYQRAQAFLWENLNNKTIFNLRLNADFLPDSSGLWMAEYGPDSKTFFLVPFSNPKKTPLFDQQRLADSLTVALNEPFTASELPFERVIWINADSLTLPINGKNYLLERATYRVSPQDRRSGRGTRTEAPSPDGKWVAFSEGYNLYVKSTESGEVFPLSTDGFKNYEYATYYGWGDLIKGENGDRPEHFSASWSADSRYLRTSICDLRQAQKMYLLDYSVDSLYRADLWSYYRGSPGDTTIVQMTPVYYDMRSKKEIPTRLEKRGYVMDYATWWIKDSDEVLIADRSRGYKKLDLFTLDLQSGKKKLLVSESSETNIVESLGIELFESFGKFTFFSERNGWQQLYACDLKTGAVAALAPGEYIVHRIVQTDTEQGWIYFLASGKNPADNPYFQYLYRVSIKGGKVESLTQETGNHNVRFSPDGRYFIDELSAYNTPATFSLRESATGKILLPLTTTDIRGLQALHWKAPEAFTAIARDGKTTIYGAVWKPTNFDPAKKYPIIDHTYTGPHTQVFPMRFEQNFYAGLQDLAELGFVIVRIDGMGTYGRSKAFHDVSYKNMGKNLLDHVLAIRQLGERYAWADTSRVGIFGHSAGGYDAGHAVLEFPDFYKVAVASSADHDFRMEKAWWPEMYMGWPVDSSYHLASNITMAGNLKGKLLITHGGMDENVNPSATFKLAEALIKADKEFDMLILPSQHHGYQGQHSNYFRKKRWNYFVENLLGATPIWNVGAGN